MSQSHLAQGETGGLGLESPELGPLLRGDVLGHEGVRGLDVGEGRGCALKVQSERYYITLYIIFILHYILYLYYKVGRLICSLLYVFLLH